MEIAFIDNFQGVFLGFKCRKTKRKLEKTVVREDFAVLLR